MCGIFGTVSKSWAGQAEAAASFIRHRGPDDYGSFRDGDLFLAHYRLAIQDLTSAGHQPMQTPDGRYTVLLNGEIYNHYELRKELPSTIPYRSSCDAESLLYAFAEWRERAFGKLNGIFTAVLYDAQEKELFLVRDPFGVKPCYYLQAGEGFAFSSELKAIAHLSEVPLELDVKALMNYMSFLWSPGPQTPLIHLRKLLPGHYLRYRVKDHSQLEIQTYFEIPFHGDRAQQSEAGWIERIDEALQQAVSRQLLSDVPVGYFISGGLDSSLIAAIAKKVQPGKPLTGFTINTGMHAGADGFEDDLPYAVRLAEWLGIDLQIVEGEVRFIEEFSGMIAQLDEPQADIAPIYVSRIAAEARKRGCTVLLTGTGGDDVFAGYRRHQLVPWDQMMYKAPAALRKLLFLLSEYIRPEGPKSRRLQKLLGRYQSGGLLEAMAASYRWMDRSRILGLFSETIRKELGDYDPVQLLLDSCKDLPGEHEALNTLLFWDQKFFLPDHNLNYTDKMSMMHGVEVRVPFLDPDLVALSAQIPAELKIKGKVSKYILKKVAERYLPKDLIYRPKTGFGAPVREWIMRDYSSHLDKALSESEISRQGVFNPEAVRQLIRDNQDKKVDASYILLEILAIHSWLDRYAPQGSIP